MRRRDFIKVIAGSAVGWPLLARAQQGERVRHIGVLISLAPDDKEGQARLAAFLQGLQELGWIDGRNVRVTRWGGGDGERARKYIAELVALTPDVILASGGSLVACGSPEVEARAQAATRPAFRFLTTAWAGNGWNCSSRSRQA
jgi:hypothetical protein